MCPDCSERIPEGVARAAFFPLWEIPWGTPPPPSSRILKDLQVWDKLRPAKQRS